LTETLLKLRDLARGLIPATILSDGLVFALRRLAQDTESLYGLRVTFSADSDIEISDELVSAEVYHIVEEAMNNALKHSSCRKVEVRMKRKPQEIVVSICDDGRGLPKQGNGNGLGLKIMRHRAEFIGANISVTSGGTGTEVTCRIPLGRVDRRER
jgi:signal transduction histidine kinase